MAYIKKNATIKREEFRQLIAYILQVKETVETLQERNTKQFNISPWLEALQIHMDILDRYANQLAVRNNITIDIPKPDKK